MSKGIALFARDAATARGDMPDAPLFRTKGGASFSPMGALCLENVSGCFSVGIEGELQMRRVSEAEPVAAPDRPGNSGGEFAERFVEGMVSVVLGSVGGEYAEVPC